MKGSRIFEELRDENPRKGANIISIITFWYTMKIFRKGHKRDLDESDLTKPLDEHKSSILGEKIAKIWTKQIEKSKKNKKQISLWWVIILCFYKKFLGYGFILVGMELGVRIYQPMFLGLLLRYFRKTNVNKPGELLHEPLYFNRLLNFWTSGQSPIQIDEAYIFASGIVLCSMLTVLVLHPYMLAVMHLGMQIRVAVCSLIYRKVLRMDMSKRGNKTEGNVVNLMSNDVNRFDMAVMFLHYLWIAPTQLCILLYFLTREVGKPAAFGIAVVAAFIPLQAFFGYLTAIYRHKTASRTDNRVRQMTEIIQGIQVIKMYAWEYAFADMIHNSRKNEIIVLKKTSYIRGLIMSFIMFVTRLAIFVTALAFVLESDYITAEKVFVITSYYQILRQTMSVFFPQAVAQMAETNVAIKRIQHFMMSPETEIGDCRSLAPNWIGSTIRSHRPDDPRPSIHIIDVTAKYGNDICLENINLSINPKETIALIGKVGSGKSVMLSLILGELQPLKGDVYVRGTISYAAQEPWLFAGSVRQNILFGREYDYFRYQAVVKVCALVRDFSILPYGDRSLVGERGISLSGGQRARVNLARAVYKKADIYLLDDPLSAVDAHVGQHLYHECISGFLSDKIVILVTHQLQHLRNANKLVLIDNGRICAIKSYVDLQNSQLEYASFLPKDLLIEDNLMSTSKTVDHILRHVSATSGLHTMFIDQGESTLLLDEPIVQAEMTTLGAVDFYVYQQYFKAAGGCKLFLLVLSLFFAAQMMASAGDFYLAKWIHEEETMDNTKTYSQNVRIKYIIICSILIVLTIFLAVVRSLVFFTSCMRSSVNLHDAMFNSIIRATMRFFNLNTSGRILNRFSKDLGNVDEFLPNAMIDCVQIMLNLIGCILVVGIIEPILLIPTCAMCIGFYLFRNFYLSTSRSVKRLEGITKSPVFGHLNATIQGLDTIRSTGNELLLVKEFDEFQDTHSSAWYMFIATSRAFGFYLDFICAIYIGIVTFSFLLLPKESNGSSVGLAITQCIGLSGLFQWGMRQSAELENQMTSVERVLEFTRIDHEANLESQSEEKPPKNWPTEGEIRFIDVIMYYNINEPAVLKNLSFVISPTEKIGIVGRTGAGKSSLISTIFRLAYFQGWIMIDGVDVGQMGLHDLRKKISIIPQEPFLFNGTMRYNLDPFNEYDDEKILNALIEVEIKSAIIQGTGCLDDMVSDCGANISTGERQMICLARAILRNNKILVLDEATANVDPQTDKFIQNTIRTKFADCTVLTIAHRLHTVMDSDRVLVMDAGNIVEFDHPYILLKNDNGSFSGMVKKTGSVMAQNLKIIAKKHYEQSSRKKK